MKYINTGHGNELSLDNIQSEPLIVHLVYRLDVGGMENGIVNLINNMPEGKYNHVIICMTYFTDFYKRIKVNNVGIYALEKKEGNDISVYFKLFRLFRKLKPAILHTRNLPTLEGALVGALSGVPFRVHGEHGRDIYDIDGKRLKYAMLRKFCDLFINTYISVSRDLAGWLVRNIGVKQDKVVQIYNGVDSNRFFPATQRVKIQEFPCPEDAVVIGTVGRMQTVKDQLNLVRAFILLKNENPEYENTIRLILIGDGPLLDEARQILRKNGVEYLAWTPGVRNDIARIMQSLDIFVLPSLAEGISNTILEAMASGLPVIATNVGGNPELVINGENGCLVPASSPEAIKEKLLEYIENKESIKNHGISARKQIEKNFTMAVMTNKYMKVYDDLLNSRVDKR